MDKLQLINKCLEPMGLELHGAKTTKPHHDRLVRLLEMRKVNVVIDVGANTGQFAGMLRQSGYSGKIVSFEPLSSAHNDLVANSASDPDWIVAPRMAIGDSAGEVEINVSVNKVSSSILSMTSLCEEAAPGAKYCGSEKTPVARLDTAVKSLNAPEDQDNVFIKIDVQGYENQVLCGAENLIARSVGVQLEMSLAPVYQGQTLFIEMLAMMRNLGFELYDINPAFIDHANARLLQVDGLFFRSQTSDVTDS